MEAEDFIIIGVVAKELEKEGVGSIQAHRIGKAVAVALGALRVTSTKPN